MGCLLQTICQQFDHVIIDSPPVLLIADTMISLQHGRWGRHCGRKREDQSGRGRARLPGHNELRWENLGAVLNKVDARRDGYSGHYSYQDYYGYADYYSADASTKRNSGQDSV